MAVLLKVINEVAQLVSSPRHTNKTRALDDYPNWTNSGFTVSSGRCYVQDIHGTPDFGTIHWHFTLVRAANVATISVAGTREVGEGDHPGYAGQKITLTKPDTTEVVLYDAGGAFSGNLLDTVDITAHLNAAGTYTLTLEASVEAGWTWLDRYFYYRSSAEFNDLYLRADTDLTVDMILAVEATTPVDTITNYLYNQDFTNIVTPVESFLIQVFTPPASLAAVIYVGTSSDHKISSFFTGVQLGHFDTPEVDFNTPGRDKTLDEIQFAAQTTTPHVINVYVSLNGGVTWIYVGQDTIHKGKTGFVHPWLTAESFIVRFYGTALHLFSYGLFAVPSGMQIRTS